MLSKFYYDMFRGNQIKELVKVLLEKSGYLVLPYGYESTLSDMKKRLRDKDARNSRTVRRIRHLQICSCMTKKERMQCLLR